MRVEFSAGALEGLSREAGYAFFDIPYGASTAGAGRFLPPRKAAPWAGVRQAKAEGPQCPQSFARHSGPVAPLWAPVLRTDLPMSEDCLRLNVFTPALSDGRKRPVMVWIHGGGFTSSSGNSVWYDGGNLCRSHDVVVVSVTHRINIFGYLYLGDVADERFSQSGNAGLLDLAAALEWVRENIATFGGDPQNVTIWGESGGGAKVSALLALPAAAGLFHKAVIMSGAGVRMVEREDAARFTRAVLDDLHIGANAVPALQEVGPERLLAAMEAAVRAEAARGAVAFTRSSPAPVVDGVALPHHPFDPAAPEISADVPVVIGCTKSESAYPLLSDPLVWDDAITDSELEKRANILAGPRGPEANALYRKAHPAASPTQILIAMATDRDWRAGATQIAERKAAQNRAPVFMYRFDWESPALGGRVGAMHGVDIPFIMDNIQAGQEMVGSSETAPALAARYSSAFVQFARTGAPGFPGGPAWPAYESQSRATMLFDDACRLENDPDAPLRRFWQERG